MSGTAARIGAGSAFGPRTPPPPNKTSTSSSAEAGMLKSCNSCILVATAALGLAFFIINAQALSSSTATALQLGINNSAIAGSLLLLTVASYKAKKEEIDAKSAYKQETRDILTRNQRLMTAITVLALAAIITINILGTQGIGLASAAEIAKWSLIINPGIFSGAVIVALCYIAPSTANTTKNDPVIIREQQEAKLKMDRFINGR